MTMLVDHMTHTRQCCGMLEHLSEVCVCVCLGKMIHKLKTCSLNDVCMMSRLGRSTGGVFSLAKVEEQVLPSVIPQL